MIRKFEMFSLSLSIIIIIRNMIQDKTLEEAADKIFGINPYDHSEKEGFVKGAKWKEEMSISKEAYEDSLNMQRCSNAGYQSKINELKSEIGRMYSEEEVENILIEYVKTNPTKPYRVVQWFAQFKKK